MFKKTTIIFLFFLSASAFAQESLLGIDYMKVAKNRIIADAMLEMEPALIEYYQQGEWEGTTHEERVYGIRGMAIVLGFDKLSVDTYEVIRGVAPETPIRFLELDKQKYPNLWQFGTLMKTIKEGKESRQLYKALHGKEWSE